MDETAFRLSMIKQTDEYFKARVNRCLACLSDSGLCNSPDAVQMRKDQGVNREGVESLCFVIKHEGHNTFS